MGAKMGSVARLEAQGILAIPLEMGVRHFMHVAMHKRHASSPILAARLAGLPTWQRSKSHPTPALRFLEDVRHFEPDVEVVSRAVLTLEKDLYLKDHNFNGTFLFPTVFGLEAMGQAVATLLGIPCFDTFTIRNVRLEKPIPVNAIDGETIEISAHRNADNTAIITSIKTRSTHFKVNHFSAEFSLDPTKIRTSAPVSAKAPGQTLELIPERGLYGDVLFQGPLFQRMTRVYELSKSHVAFSVEYKAAAQFGDYFDASLPHTLVLGDPFARDALLQAAQLPLIHAQFLPVHIGEIASSSKMDAGTHYVELYANKETASLYRCSVAAQSECGHMESLSDYALQLVSPSSPYHSIFDLLIQKHVRGACQVFQLQCPDFVVLELADSTLKRGDAQAHLLAALTQSAGLPQHSQIVYHDTGQPVLEGSNRHIALSHKDRVYVAAIGDAPIGCDFEWIDPAQDLSWFANDPIIATAIHTLCAKTPFSDFAALLLWCAKEAYFKADNKTPITAYTLISHTPSCVLFENNKGVKCMVVVGGEQFIFALTIPEKEVHLSLPKGAFSHQFMLTFEDVIDTFQSCDIATWMGKLRELPLKAIAAPLIQDMKSGKWGLVTNRSAIQVIGTANAFDTIEGRFWVSHLSGPMESTIHLVFEWFKLAEHGHKIPIAKSFLDTTWVEIIGHGRVAVRPLPHYLAPLLNRISVNHKYSDLEAHTFGMANPDKIGTPDYTQSFSTSNVQSNLVGNIYYAHYYKWQSEVRDHLLNESQPEYRQFERNSQYYCDLDQVEHFREAMPNDKVTVSAYITAQTTHYVELFFRFTQTQQQEEHLLATGNQRVIKTVSLAPEVALVEVETQD